LPAIFGIDSEAPGFRFFVAYVQINTIPNKLAVAKRLVFHAGIIIPIP